MVGRERGELASRIDRLYVGLMYALCPTVSPMLRCPYLAHHANKLNTLVINISLASRSFFQAV